VAQAAGLDARFHFWRGASGRRYLFTEVAPENLRHFENVVVLLAEVTRKGQPVAASATVIEARLFEGAGLFRELAGSSRLRPFVHFLATTPRARRAVVSDLAAVESERVIAQRLADERLSADRLAAQRLAA
jgi:hypothetical protein